MASWRSASPPPPSSAAGPITAVIAAAGSGERLGAGGPKAFVEVAGRPMIEWSIAAFRAAGPVGAVVIALPPGDDHGLHGRGLVLVSGGPTRMQSVRNALAEVRTDLVAVHDAARPLLNSSLILELLAALQADPQAAGVIAATPVSDTIKRARADGLSNRSSGSKPADSGADLIVDSTLDRNGLWAAQTPQMFRAKGLREAFSAGVSGGNELTDEAMLLEASGARVLIHPSPRSNLKVTTPFDLRVAEALLLDRASD